jgi:hypothetical protein
MKANWTGYISFTNYLLQEEDGDVSIYWITLIKREDIRNWKREHWITLCITFTLEEAIDLS